MRIFNQILTFIGGSVRRLTMLAAVLFFLAGQILGWWDAPSLINVNIAPPPAAESSLAKGVWTFKPGVSSEENASRHFEKHGAEFPYTSEKDYITAAIAFTKRPPPGTLSVVQSDGDTVYYNPEANFFAVKDDEGRIRTFFRPDPEIHGYPTNMDYFKAQEGR